jgi:hypothetical protein
MRSIGGDVDGVPASHQGLLAAKGCQDLAFERDERLFEVVPMGRRPAPPGGMCMSITQKRPFV